MDSGPKRFEYDTDDKKWYEVAVMDGVKNCRQVKEDINSLLSKEMKSLVGADLKFSLVCSDIVLTVCFRILHSACCKIANRAWRTI